MTTVRQLVSIVAVCFIFLLNAKCAAQSQAHKTCILDVALLSLQGPNYGVDELCVAGGNKVTIVIRCSSGSRYLSQASINPCLEQQPLVSLQYDTVGEMGGNVSLLLWLNLAHEVVDSAMDVFQPSTDIFKSIKVVGDLRGTKFNFAIAQRCSSDASSDNFPGILSTLTNSSGHPWQNDAAADSSAVTKQENPSSSQSLHTAEPTTIDRQVPGRETMIKANEGQAQSQPTDAVVKNTTTQGLSAVEGVGLGQMDEVVMKEDEELHNELTHSPLGELVPEGRDVLMNRLEGLASAQVKKDVAKPENDLKPNVNSEKTLTQNKEKMEAASSGDGAQHVKNEARSLRNEVDMASPDSSNINSKFNDAETVSDSSLLTVDPTVLRLVAIIAKSRTSATATTGTTATTTTILTTTTQSEASNQFRDPNNPSAELHLKSDIDSGNTETRTASLSSTFLSSSLPARSPFSLEVIDRFDDGGNSVVEVNDRQLTMSPFFEDGSFDDNGGMGADQDAGHIENATSSMFGSGRDPQNGGFPDVVPDSHGPVPTAEEGKDKRPSDETPSSPNLLQTTTDKITIVTTKSTTGIDDNELFAGFPHSGSSQSTTTTSKPSSAASASSSTTTSISISTNSITADNSKLTPTHVIINESVDETTETTTSTSTEPTAPSKTDNKTQSTETTKTSEAAKSSQPASRPHQKLNTTSTTTATTASTTTAPTTTSSPLVVLHNTTLMMGSSGNSSGLALPPDDDAADDGEEEDDTFWPIVAALVIGIPSIIVFGIAITVIHKRRLASPARLRAASMYPSLKLDPRRSALHLSSHSLHRSSIDV